MTPTIRSTTSAPTHATPDDGARRGDVRAKPGGTPKPVRSASSTAAATTRRTPTKSKTSKPTPATRRRPGPDVYDHLTRARKGLAAAAMTSDPLDRYAMSHLAALRAGAAVLAARAQLDPPTRRRRVHSVWTLVAHVAPELSEWAVHFAGSARRRSSAEARIPGAVSARQADDLMRDAATFIALVETTLGVDHQPALAATVSLRAG